MIYTTYKMNTSPIKIEAHNVSKKFRLIRGSRALLNFIRSYARREQVILRVLDDITISVKAGEVVGIIGKNGSGKSTLLKIIAGLHRQDSGTVKLSGAALYLSGFSFGTNPYLTVRANITLIGTIFGLRRKEIREKIPLIAEFAGLTEFLDVETFKLSSGMMTRLNLSSNFFCMEHVRPEILLMDEVLSVGGDIEFQAKSMGKVESLVHSGASVLFASHDLPFIEKFCHRVIWLDHGKIKRQGPAKEVIADYIQTYG